MKRILVINDDTDILQVTELILSIKGYEVITLGKSIHTHGTATAYNPDVILLDINSDSSQEIGICKKLKLNMETASIPVILFSGENNAKLAKDSFADRILLKPFDIDQLLYSIEQFPALNSLPLLMSA